MLVKPKRDLKTVIRAIKANRGLMYKAAQSLGVDPKTLYNYSKKHPEAIQRAVDDARGDFVDQSELGLMAGVDNGEPWAIMFTLRTLGKNRGYIETQSTTVNAEIVINPYGTINNRIAAQLGNGEGPRNTGENDGDANEG